jgi:hypothetical protein
MGWDCLLVSVTVHTAFLPPSSAMALAFTACSPSDTTLLIPAFISYICETMDGMAYFVFFDKNISDNDNNKQGYDILLK